MVLLVRPEEDAHADLPVTRCLRRGNGSRCPTHRRRRHGRGRLRRPGQLPARSTQPTLVTNWSQFTQIFGDFVEGSYLAHAVYGYFQNGGGACYVVRIGGNGAASPAARAELTAASGGAGGAAASLGAFRVQALAEGAEGNDISVEVADSGAEGAAEDAFKVVVKKGGKVEETFDNVTTKKGRQNVVTVVNAPVQADPPRGARRGRRARSPAAPSLSPAAGLPPRPTWRPTTTSAIPPTAPGSAASRRSTRSPWSASPT